MYQWSWNTLVKHIIIIVKHLCVLLSNSTIMPSGRVIDSFIQSNAQASPKTTKTDHQPVRLDLNPPNDSKGSLNVKIPIKVMKSEEVKAGLQSIWQDTMGSESASEDLQKNWPSPPPFYNKRPSAPSNRLEPLKQN